MGATNLGLVESIIAKWERGEFGFADWADPEIEYVYVDGPAPGRWIGPSAMTEGAREWLSAWEDFRFEIEDYRALDARRVLVLNRFSGRGKASGLELEQMHSESAWLFEVDAGKVTRLVRYLDRDRALAELGLTA